MPEFRNLASASSSASLPPYFLSVDGAIEGDSARHDYKVDGTGIKIGIVSDSFDMVGTGSNAASDEASGKLPSAANVHVIQDAYNGARATDEGRAIAQIAHSIAPGAQIYFYSVGGSQADMAHAIAALQQQGCQIILDDEGWIDEPFYQNGGVINKAIDTATAAGVTYFTAAGNIGSHYVEEKFSSMSTTLPIGIFGQTRSVTAHNFGTASSPTPFEQLSITPGDKVLIEMQWNQPFASIGNSTGATSNLGLYLFRVDPNGPVVVARSDFSEVGADPLQIIQYTAPSDSTANYELAVISDAGMAPALFKIVFIDPNAGGVQFTDPNAGSGSGSVVGHALDPNAITVGAAYYFTATTGTEDFTSIGPGTFYYDANGNALSAPASAGKPGIIAPDGGTTTVNGIARFFGTSAATPAAAAVGALMLQANPQLDPADISNLLRDSAIALPDPAASGAGLVNADAAVGMAKTLQIQMPAGNGTVLGTHLGNTFLGALGSHTINGVGGVNTLDYTAAPAAVTVNIQGGEAANGFGGYDMFTGIQNVNGSPFNDKFGAAPGTHFINGGGGHDTVVFAGPATSFTLVTGANGVVTVAGADTTMNLTGIEFLQFSDRTVFVENGNVANVAALYSAALGRAPDIAGLQAWEDLYRNGLSASVQAGNPVVSRAQSVPTGRFASIADGFTQSAEFQQKYGNLSDSGFVTQLYQNVLGRAPDQAGLNGWLGDMHQGDSSGQVWTRDMVLVGFAASPENLAKIEAAWLHIA